MMWQILIAVLIILASIVAHYHAQKYQEYVKEKQRKEGKLKDEDYWDYWWWGM